MRNAAEDLAMCEAATPGPWYISRQNGDFSCVADGVVIGAWPSDTEFIIQARTALPYWIDRAVSLEKEVGMLRDALEKIDIHIRSTGDPVPHIIQTLKDTLPEYKEWWDIGE